MDQKDWYTSLFLKQANIDITNEIVKQFRSSFWCNIRTNQYAGLRLTELGLKFIIEKSDIKVHTIALQKDTTFTPQLLVWLDRHLASPFFINHTEITVLTEKAAFEIYLFAGDIRKMGYSKALASRFKLEAEN